MNKIKLLIVPDQKDFDKMLTTKIKKFNSERNLFFSNLYNTNTNNNNKNSENNENLNNYKNNNIFNNNYYYYCDSTNDLFTQNNNDGNNNNNNNNDKDNNEMNNNINSNYNNQNQNQNLNAKEIKLSKIERTKTFLLGGFLKRCKSSKDIYHQRQNDQPQQQQQQQSQQNDNEEVIRNSTTYKNLDDFEKNYLFSSNRKNIVKELRKNFESGDSQKSTNINIINNNNTNDNNNNINNNKIATPFEKCQFSANDLQKRLSLRENSINISDAKENIHHNDNNNNNCNLVSKPPKPRKPISLIQRHSFYLPQNNYQQRHQQEHEHEQQENRQSFNSLDYNINNNNFEFDNNSKNIYKNLMRDENLIKSVNNLSSIHKYGSYNTYNKCDQNIININNNMNNNNGDNNRNSIYDNDNELIRIANKNLINSSLKNIIDENNLYQLYMQTETISDLYRHSNNNLNNNNNNNSRIRKCNSVNKIDLDILKSELDDFVDPQWRSSTHFNFGFRSHRGYGIKKELDLEQKIDLEIKMREGSAKLLAACNSNAKHATKTIGFSGNSTLPHNTQILEAAKNLLTSNERMTAYMAELQKRKRDRDSLHSISAQQTKNSQTNPTTKSTTATAAQSKPTGKLSLNEIRMPLMWRDTDHFKNKGDHRRFAVFCLAKIGTEIYDTSLLCPIDRNSTDISFHDAILFTNITPDFELKLEVYAVMMESDLTIASTPRKIKNTIHSSISRTVGKRLAANLKDELHNTKIGPKYDLIATATLKLPDASNLPHTHDLTTATNTINNNSGGGVILTGGNSGTLNSSTHTNCKLPLFGHFCCRLAVQPDAITVSQCIGSNLSLTIGTEAILVDTGGGGAGGGVQQKQRNSSRGKPVAITVAPTTINSQITLIPNGGYGKLQAFQLQLWTSENLATEELPATLTLDITRDTKLKHLDEFSILICNMEEGKMKQYILSTNSLTESAKWYTSLKRTIKEHIQWEHLTLEPCMELATPGNTKQYYLRSSSTLAGTLSSSSSTRFASLYDQVPILEHNIDNVRSSATIRPSVHDIFSIQNHNNVNSNGDEPSISTTTTGTTTTTTTTIINNDESSSPTLNDYRNRTNSSSASSSAERCSSSQSTSTLSGSSIGSINSRKNYNWTTEKTGSSSTTSSTSSTGSSSGGGGGGGSGSGGSKNNIKNGK